MGGPPRMLAVGASSRPGGTTPGERRPGTIRGRAAYLLRERRPRPLGGPAGRGWAEADDDRGGAGGGGGGGGAVAALALMAGCSTGAPAPDQGGSSATTAAPLPAAVTLPPAPSGRPAAGLVGGVGAYTRGRVAARP